MRRSPRAVAAVLSALGLLAVGGASGSSQFVPIYAVNDTEDAPDASPDGICASTHLGLCTLRAAIQEAESAGGGIVQLPPATGTGDFQLTIPTGNEGPTGSARTWSATGDLDISTNIRVDGVGFADSVIDGTGTHRIFDVHAGGTLWLRNLTVEDGAAELDPVTGHEHGGAIHNHGTFLAENVAVIDSSATAPGWGGGGITNAGVAQLVNVTVAGNTTGLRGGGIENNTGELRMLGVTIAQNSAPTGGGIYLGPTGRVFTAAALVAKNKGGDCARAAGGAVASSGSNLAGDGSCGFTAASDRSGDPGFDTSGFVGPLFYPLQATSRAVDRGALCQNVDIRGVSRPQDGNGDGVGRCDAGSYEREATAPVTCNGSTATIYVAHGVIVGGPRNGHPYTGRLNGTSGSDVMVGSTGRDQIFAGKGDDVLCGGEKNDLLDGGSGADTITGDAAGDTMVGGPGKDVATDFNFNEGDRKTTIP